MYFQCIIGAIFTVFILCVHCDNAVNYNESMKIYVPSEPLNLTVINVTSEIIHLSWTPPSTFNIKLLTTASDDAPKPDPDQATERAKHETLADEPVNDVESHATLTDASTIPEKLDYSPFLYKNDKSKYNDEYASSDILFDKSYRSLRERRSHRHRKRRQDSNSTDPRLHLEKVPEDTHEEFQLPIEVVKKASANIPHKDLTQIAYVLYYEQGVPRYNAASIAGVQKSTDVKRNNVFPSDLGMENYSKATRNITLLNKLGVLTKVVGFRLRNLKPFTPYKIWVKAFYKFSFSGVSSSDLLERLGPQSEPLYVLTDVRPPSAPIILNLTCDQPNGMLYLQWRQPLEYNNSLDQYVVTVRKVPEQQPRTTLRLPTNKTDIDTAINVPVELWNVSRYEVKIFAVTRSVAKPGALVNGLESPPEPVELWNVSRYEVKIFAVTRSVAKPGILVNGLESPPEEYEIVVAKSAALGHTSHHSYRPENRLKNRYLNITAYDHSRVCVSAGARCGAAGCVGAGRGAACDYVNANFIDGMLPALDARAERRLERKLQRRAKPQRQPSVKQSKPPPNLAEGIESAFLNIEFSGIVESEEQPEDSDSDRSDDDSELDDVYVDISEWCATSCEVGVVGVAAAVHRYSRPHPATLDAFWRMIWQHRVHTVVMITNLVERGRRKCDMYWPAGGRGSSAEFGGVRVTLLHEDVRAAYTVRKLRVRLIHKVTNVQVSSTGWFTCAGVGRTGTYIVLDAQLNQLKLTGTLSPLGFLCRARTQRNHLVQTEEQYVFVHDALLEHVRSGNTEVEFAKAREYLQNLLEDISEEELAVMDLNLPRPKSVNDVNGETSSIKSSQNISDKDEMVDGSQISIKTDELNSELSKSSVRDGDNEEQSTGLVNGDESEGVYDLAPRSTDTYSKNMAAYNNLNEQEKEEIRRANRAENYALLERMRSLANRNNVYQGPPPVNLLEKQFQLITRSCVEPSVCARAPHNADKNRPGGILPSDSARVMLVPKPGVEGSEYVNASWVCGWRRLREFAVAQHPGDAPELWRLLWDHTAQIVLLLHDPDDPECDVFWPTEEDKELFVANFRASFVCKDVYVAHRKSERKPAEAEPEVNGYRRQESECADDERLIPDNNSPVIDTEPAYRFDRTELRLERLSAGCRDLSARKSIANGDLFSSLSEKKNGPKSPKSPSKMSLKNFKLSSPTKFKFPEWGARTAGSPPDTAPPPPPVEPALSVEEETELRRPCYYFEKVTEVPDNVSSDRIIEVTNVSVHSLQDDYQLSVKFIKCSGWLEGETTSYVAGRPDDNEYVHAVRSSAGAERDRALDALIAPYRDSFGLIEFVAGCQMEYKNGPVIVVDKYGGWKALSFCALSAACGGLGAEAAELYCSWALSAHARCPAGPHSPPRRSPHTRSRSPPARACPNLRSPPTPPRRCSPPTAHSPLTDRCSVHGKAEPGIADRTRAGNAQYLYYTQCVVVALVILHVLKRCLTVIRQILPFILYTAAIFDLTRRPLKMAVNFCSELCILCNLRIIGANLGNFEVRAGSTESLSGGTVTTIRDVTKHPDYQESPLANDIAVVLLQTPFAITNNINVLFLPPQNTFIPDGQSVKVVSWGFETMTGPQLQTLKKVYLKKVSLDECSAGFENVGNVAVSDCVLALPLDQCAVIMAYKALCLALALVCAASAAPESRLVGGTPTTIEEFPYIVALTYTYPGPGITVQRCVGAVICASEEGAVGTCRGDSGAPMVIDQVVVGISSYFHECGDDLPDVFTRTDRFTDWIVSVATAPNDDDVTPVRVKSVDY
ncbi:Tyrosine-protein phosphatase 99A [Papilio machaon]|uniref:Tyrosine-protein phosphatase 99A n=1 Tax=Papilio machaon TaxID=76193 RepID=A0A194RLB2_PAPMA|nr:Tyrosine-protein phosphatase 99A [Papilio machaon]